MTAAATSTGNSLRRGSLVAAVLLPLAIASSNQWVLWWFTETTRRDHWQVAVCFTLFVLQVGVVGFIAGRFLPGILSWIVFGWSLFLIVVVSTIGGLITWSCERIDEWVLAQQYAGVNLWGSMWFIRPKGWWLPWICLATGFLVATLWIFREKGFRLVRVDRRKRE